MISSSRPTAACIAFFATLLVASIATAQSLSDFKNAAGKEGCDAIPYSSLRSDCQSKGRDVDTWCKGGRGKWNCDEFDPEGLKKQIENVTKKIETLKKDKDSLNSAKSRAKDEREKRDIETKVAVAEKEIKKLEDMRSRWQKKLEDERKEIKARIVTGEKCRDYRQEVAKIFETAKSKAKGESNVDIKPLARKLVEKYKAGERGHATAINDAKRGVEKCKSKL